VLLLLDLKMSNQKHWSSGGLPIPKPILYVGILFWNVSSVTSQTHILSLSTIHEERVTDLPQLFLVWCIQAVAVHALFGSPTDHQPIEADLAYHERQMSKEEKGALIRGDWELSSVVGSGSFAVVWKAYHVSEVDENTGERRVAAIKEINRNKLSPKLVQSLEGEIYALRRIGHGNIVRLYDVLERAGHLYLVMEYCTGGDLGQWLNRQGRVGEDVAQRWMQQLAAGMMEMWRHNVVHRDLKPQNLLLFEAEDGSMELKIADFGFARALGPEKVAETLCGSPLYMAPEILTGHQYDAKADLWSIGAILFEMVRCCDSYDIAIEKNESGRESMVCYCAQICGKPPYGGANQLALLREIRSRDPVIPSEIGACISYKCKSLIYKLLRRNPVERMSFEEFFSHPFIVTNDTETCKHADVVIRKFETLDIQSAKNRNQKLMEKGDEIRTSSMSDQVTIEDQGEYVFVHSPQAKKDRGAQTKRPVLPTNHSQILHQILTQNVSEERLCSDQEQVIDAVPNEVPWQNYGRCEFLAQVANLLDSLGSKMAFRNELAADEKYTAEKFAYHLAAVQLFDVVIKSFSTSFQAEHEETAANKSMLGSSIESDGCERLDKGQIIRTAQSALSHAEECAKRLETAVSMKEIDINSFGIPHWIDVCHEAANKLAQKGAANELLGNYSQCESFYENAGLLLYFLAVEAEELRRVQSKSFVVDTSVLQKQCTAVAARWIHVARQNQL